MGCQHVVAFIELVGQAAERAAVGSADQLPIHTFWIAHTIQVVVNDKVDLAPRWVDFDPHTQGQ